MEVIGDKVGGIAVHAASRVLGLAGPGQILVTGIVRDLVAGSEIRFVDEGVRELRGVPGEWRLYAVSEAATDRALPVEDAPERPARQRSQAPILVAVGLVAVVATAGIAVVLSNARSTPAIVPRPDSVLRIDPRSGDFLALAAVDDPTGMAIEGGALWVLSLSGRTLNRVDPETANVSAVGLPAAPTGIAAGGGALWITTGFGVPGGTGGVLRIGATSRTLEATIPLADGVESVAVGDGSVWVINGVRSIVTRIDLTTRAVAGEAPVGQKPDAIAVGGGSVWVANAIDRTVWRLDSRSLAMTAEISLADPPSDLALGFDRLWVTSAIGNSVTVIDAATNVLQRTVDLSGQPRGIEAGPDAIWVALGSGEVVRIDPADPAAFVASRSPALRTTWPSTKPASGSRSGGSRLRKLGPSLALALVLWSCTSTSSPQPPPDETDSAPRGGTLRVVVSRDSPGGSNLVAAPPEPGSREPDPRLSLLDPHVDWWFDAAEILRCCLARTLLSTNGRSAEEGGAVLQPDLAESLPDISADGLIWTFKLKRGVRYGPPLGSIEVTARDFVRGMHRVLAPELDWGGSQGHRYSDIVGAEAYRAGEAASITGLETPDDYTLVIRLTSPAGDLGVRLAMPTAAPIPPDPADPSARFGTADGHMLPRPDDGGAAAIGTYGRFLVSTGPYAIEGSERLDFSLPAADQTPVAGVVPGESVALVRNPNWSAASDVLRPARPDRIEVRVVQTIQDAIAELDAGRADLVVGALPAPTIPPATVVEFQNDPERGSVHFNEVGAVRGFVMNVAQPPFDDVHVRKAMSLVLDKRRIIDMHGGPFAFRVAHHIVPDAVLNNLLLDYDPYATAGGGGASRPRRPRWQGPCTTRTLTASATTRAVAASVR